MGPRRGGEADEWALGDTECGPHAEPDPGESDPEESHRAPMIPAISVGVLAGLVCSGLVLVTTALLTDADSGDVATGPSPSTITSPVTPGPEPSDDARALGSPSRMDRCRLADEELAEPLGAAVPAMDQWQIHVSAMNALVAGAITPRQATALWDQTRAGANRNVNRFYLAVGLARFVKASCPAPGDLAEASSGLRSCAERVAGERKALEAADIAMRTWSEHIGHMEMLRAGEMSPAAAIRMWLASWRRGVQQIGAYRTAERAVDALGSC